MSNGYQKREHYDGLLFKQLIMREGYDSPTEFVQECLFLNYTTANKKLNTGAFSPEEMWKMGNDLYMTTEEFVKVFATGMRVSPIET